MNPKEMKKKIKEAAKDGGANIEVGFACNPKQNISMAFINGSIVGPVPYGKEQEFSQAVRELIERYKKMCKEQG